MTPTPHSFDYTENVHPVELEPVYWLDGQRLSRAFCHALPSGLADLLDIAMAVYAADRRSRRDYKRMASGQRGIYVRVGVRNPELWAGREIAFKLEELLYWMSGDEWSLEFAERQTAPSTAESDRFLFRLPPEPPVTVSLFSGGLDSLAGLVASSENVSARSRLLVSGYTHNRLAHQQRLQVEAIRSSWRSEGLFNEAACLRHVAVPFGIRKPHGYREEPSQRTRALVFLVLGVVTALQADTDALWVYENGVGALNLPLNETQLGIDNYRGVHPRSLILAQEFLSLALNRSIHIRNPFLFATKAQMCKPLASSRIANAVSHTVSCDGFPQRLRNQPSQCGRCTSCILRRQSLKASGLERFDRGYRYDVLNSQAKLAGRHLYDLEAMRGQVHKIGQCLDSENPWLSLCASFPELARTHAELVSRNLTSKSEKISRLFVELYRKFVWEWGWFIEEPRRVA